MMTSTTSPVSLTAGQQVAVSGRPYTVFQVGSVEVYAAQYGEDPAAALLENEKAARELGERRDIAWLCQLPGVMDGTVKAAPALTLHPGQAVTVEGRAYSIQLVGNNNVRLVSAVDCYGHRAG